MKLARRQYHKYADNDGLEHLLAALEDYTLQSLKEPMQSSQSLDIPVPPLHADALSAPRFNLPPMWGTRAVDWVSWDWNDWLTASQQVS